MNDTSESVSLTVNTVSSANNDSSDSLTDQNDCLFDNVTYLELTIIHVGHITPVETTNLLKPFLIRNGFMSDELKDSTGLEMSIAESLVVLMGGTISAEWKELDAGGGMGIINIQIPVFEVEDHVSSISSNLSSQLEPHESISIGSTIKSSVGSTIKSSAGSTTSRSITYASSIMERHSVGGESSRRTTLNTPKSPLKQNELSNFKTSLRGSSMRKQVHYNMYTPRLDREETSGFDSNTQSMSSQNQSKVNTPINLPLANFSVSSSNEFNSATTNTNSTFSAPRNNPPTGATKTKRVTSILRKASVQNPKKQVRYADEDSEQPQASWQSIQFSEYDSSIIQSMSVPTLQHSNFIGDSGHTFVRSKSLETDGDGFYPCSFDAETRLMPTSTNKIPIDFGGKDENAYLQGKILIVDDSSVFRHIIKKMLQVISKEYDITEVADGLEAIATIQQEHYNIVFMDLEMPKLNGHSASKKLREFGHTVPIIAVSAQSLTADEISYLEHSGITEVISKPVSKDLLRSIMKKFNKKIQIPSRHFSEIVPEEEAGIFVRSTSDVAIPPNRRQYSSLSSPQSQSSADFSCSATPIHSIVRSNNTKSYETSPQPPIQSSKKYAHCPEIATKSRPSPPLQIQQQLRLYAANAMDKNAAGVSTPPAHFQQQKAPMKQESHVSIPIASKPVVLVVDDSLINRQILVKMLKSLGLFSDIVEVATGLDAVKMCHLKKFSIIFMDLEMPGMNGDEAAARIRATGNMTPIVAVTGNIVRAEDKSPLRELRITEILTKPVSKHAIQAICNNYINDSKGNVEVNGTSAKGDPRKESVATLVGITLS
ncbi:UNVERIFIED_CONTAM: hypothetical protein HDU68_011863 [Siphonaria sp. JEL0065]|nr:hypothetical protein HDU68_011863 [Siphonaria sp. JEL0065]